MDKKVISIISKYIKQNKAMSSSQLASLISEKSTLTFSRGTLQNYIGQIKKLGDKVISTKPGNTTDDRIAYPEDHHKTKIIGKVEKPKQCKSELITAPKVTKSEVTNILIDDASKIKMVTAECKLTPVESKPLTCKDHIRGYLLAYTDKNFSEIANLLHSNNLCMEYTLGTLRNYISLETQKRVKSTSSETLLKENIKESEKKYTHIKNHEVIVVDQSTCVADDIQYIVDHAGKEVSTIFSVIAFSENTIVAGSKLEKPTVKFDYQPTLGINLLESISTALHLAASKDTLSYNTNMTIITSGGDNMSKHVDYADIRYALNELINEHGWTVNLIFTGARKEEGAKIAQWLGVDTSNLTVGNFDPQVITNSMHKRVNKLKAEEGVSLNYYK